MMPKVSVIIGAYNYLSYLKLCMRALERQTFRDFEVIIADDGSGPEVREWLDSYAPFFPVKHIWQEDKGFRKCRILNRAILESGGEYIIFLDADCVVAKDFIEAHWKRRKEGAFLGGRRVMMGRRLSEGVTFEMVDNGSFDGPTLWGAYQSLSGRIKYYEESLRILSRIRGEAPFSLLGCNFSVHRKDILSVNGFDEEYETRGGGEDTDISHRLKAAGFKMRSARYVAVQFHLGHEKTESKDASARMFREKSGMVRGPEDAGKVKSRIAEWRKG
ncbi:MAG TPA: Chondroitin polymerase [Deltaproteobacteria bacterium]|nr:MAG: hypothetical protein A2Z79_02750 [Deltaproteobacteria bacterium GWA2_55_82]OGQ64333.1 MAG: hypothetical protein A3I81_04390 [Deltaproteobacteria bacterium RIFCSPLOWO2_02_FULL_55_12]OIJ74321.1 MAG: hypothetical protein A2V21_308650 [Deltaproteobacteria bacterium GWC2_55_46]HBG46962.1 Chondroitin polymerase [Deltaproteobacteria bacterium]HCY10980.1 Chondroitin polymerase [Deltaproteobacteria bacterium]